jgi:hypothetical protein
MSNMDLTTIENQYNNNIQNNVNDNQNNVNDQYCDKDMENYLSSIDLTNIEQNNDTHIIKINDIPPQNNQEKINNYKNEPLFNMKNNVLKQSKMDSFFIKKNPNHKNKTIQKNTTKSLNQVSLHTFIQNKK